MTERVPASDIETIVGIERQTDLHVGRAISAEKRFYILHSQQCFDYETDLRDCLYSMALDDNGINEEIWTGRMDEPVPIKLIHDGKRVHNPYWVVPADEGH